jgi:L-lactate utilization protein LutC
MDFSQTKGQAIVNKVIANLKDRGIDAQLVANAEEAKEAVKKIIPDGAEVMTMISITLDQTSLAEMLNKSPYVSVKNKLKSLNRDTQNQEMQQLGAAPQWTVGSVHAVTEDGQVLIASNTGSQLPAYAYGAENVVWIVGTQKIVKDFDEGMRRIEEYIKPQESERAREAYNLPDFSTNLSKLLIINKEIKPGRIKLIFVDEVLGF